MEKQLEIIRRTRGFVLQIVNDMSLDEINRIPAGFSNNVVWNLGHLIAAQQGVCYLRAGLPMIITKELFNKFKPESKPEAPITAEELEELKGLLFSTIDDLEKDLAENKIADYPAWTTRYGVEITSIKDAVEFLSFHEGLHTGYIMALRRAVRA